jgi:hypothetical protein
MKTILIAAAAFGLLISGAAADCPGHAKKEVLASVDKEATTASVAMSKAATATTPTAGAPAILQDDEEAKTD